MIIVLNELDTSMFAPQQQQATTLARNGCHRRVFPKEIKASRPYYKDGTLYFSDGTKSGEMEDDCQYLYDLARGK